MRWWTGRAGAPKSQIIALEMVQEVLLFIIKDSWKEGAHVLSVFMGLQITALSGVVDAGGQCMYRWFRFALCL